MVSINSIAKYSSVLRSKIITNTIINPKLFLGYMEKPHLSFGFI